MRGSLSSLVPLVAASRRRYATVTPHALASQVAALTDRGQRLNTLVAPVYQEKRQDIADLVAALEPASEPVLLTPRAAPRQRRGSAAPARSAAFVGITFFPVAVVKWLR